MANKKNKIRKKSVLISKRRTGEKNYKKRQTAILKKLNPPPKPKPEVEPEVEPEVHSAPRLSQSVEVTGPRSCRLQKCVFTSCPNRTPSAQQNEKITFFPFPTYPGPASAWARRVTRANGQQFWPRMTSRVCSLHFPPWQISTDAGGVPALQKGAVPTALPCNQGELPNIEEVTLPRSDTNEQFGPLNNSEDLVMKIEIDDENPEMKRAVASLVDIPPPENGIKLQCVNVGNKNATVHYLSVDKDYTVNHTHVNINKNNVATLHYVDTKNTVNNTSKCINLNEDQISSYEALVNPNITQTPVMKIEIVPNRNDRENGFDIKINSKLVGENNTTPDEDVDETVHDTLPDHLDADTRVKSNDDEETEEVILGAADTSEIQTCDNDFDETVIVKMEYESDSDNDLKPET